MFNDWVGMVMDCRVQKTLKSMIVSSDIMRQGGELGVIASVVAVNDLAYIGTLSQKSIVNMYIKRL